MDLALCSGAKTSFKLGPWICPKCLGCWNLQSSFHCEEPSPTAEEQPHSIRRKFNWTCCTGGNLTQFPSTQTFTNDFKQLWPWKWLGHPISIIWMGERILWSGIPTTRLFNIGKDTQKYAVQIQRSEVETPVTRCLLCSCGFNAWDLPWCICFACK